jgi:hypothetical protein
MSLTTHLPWSEVIDCLPSCPPQLPCHLGPCGTSMSGLTFLVSFTTSQSLPPTSWATQDEGGASPLPRQPLPSETLRTGQAQASIFSPEPSLGLKPSSSDAPSLPLASLQAAQPQQACASLGLHVWGAPPPAAPFSKQDIHLPRRSCHRCSDLQHSLPPSSDPPPAMSLGAISKISPTHPLLSTSHSHEHLTSPGSSLLCLQTQWAQVQILVPTHQLYDLGQVACPTLQVRD